MDNKTHFMVNKLLKSFFEKKTLNLKKNYYCMFFNNILLLVKLIQEKTVLTINKTNQN